MATTNLADVQEQMQKFWSPIFTKQLRANLLLGSLVNKEYEGEIKEGGDTVYVSQINAPEGDLLDVGVDADAFQTESLDTQRVAIVANKRAVAAFEFQDLVKIQSQIDHQDPKVLEALNYSMRRQINRYLYSLVAPSAGAPDHVITGVTDFNASQLSGVRTLAAQALWEDNPGWYGLLDPQYYTDLMNAVTLTSGDYGASDAPVISGKIGLKRYGFSLFEDNSRPADYGLFFHPDSMHLVTQVDATVKISDLHSQKKFGYVMSVDLIFGAALGIDGAKKHILVTA